MRIPKDDCMIQFKQLNTHMHGFKFTYKHARARAHTHTHTHTHTRTQSDTAGLVERRACGMADLVILDTGAKVSE